MPIPVSTVKMAVSFVLQVLKVSTDEISIHFVTKSKISSLHKKFFNDPTPTDCITFPIDPPHLKKQKPHVLGELFICPRVAMEYAQVHQISALEELFRYLIHGILHLIGYNDLTSKERALMRRKETALLKRLKMARLLKNGS